MDFNSRKKKNKNNYDLYNENINIYLEENDNYILDLESKVQTLKLIGSNMRDEVKTSNSLLYNLSDQMDNVNRKLTGVYRNVKNIIKRKGNKYMVYLVLFFLFLLFLMNYLYRKNR
ncbi:conserved Plasmodium protein, unknown function [Plasmodium vinckei lentum]|uniref:t-SNARE coiled-coil homology domain-containing protein n=3 Tax=Plasmodium vinckei TaxID=5860 RepID=A0A6V7T9I4_PLAVN|nr:conserved Plasmodium protein, unknown function [Plasmodium vinckei lentum]CAD2098091.1 conserved Plasmodium protein, unknown function [Plasmodium vinckei brucechwatti]CAD2109377.1 conserved Plasmodium protein, unknown function [Plasmodium vinckei petteri]